MNYFEILRPFLKKAGKLAIDRRNFIQCQEKCDKSIVTEIDLKISRMFQNFVKKNFKGHLILDEETVFNKKNFKEQVNNTEYVWIIDPIDGTKAYFNGSNLFAIAIALYRNLEPVFGVIYLPSTSQIIYNDDNNSYKIINAFTRKENKTVLKFIQKNLDSNSLVYFPVKNAAQYIKNYKYTFIDGYSAYIYSFDVLTNIARGAFMKDNISMWDIYVVLPIAEKLGIKVYNIEDGSELKKIDFNLFKENLKAKNIWLVCHSCYKDDMFSILK